MPLVDINNHETTLRLIEFTVFPDTPGKFYLGCPFNLTVRVENNVAELVAPTVNFYAWSVPEGATAKDFAPDKAYATLQLTLPVGALGQQSFTTQWIRPPAPGHWAVLTLWGSGGQRDWFVVPFGVYDLPAKISISGTFDGKITNTGQAATSYVLRIIGEADGKLFFDYVAGATPQPIPAGATVQFPLAATKSMGISVPTNKSLQFTAQLSSLRLDNGKVVPGELLDSVSVPYQAVPCPPAGRRFQVGDTVRISQTLFDIPAPYYGYVTVVEEAPWYIVKIILPGSLQGNGVRVKEDVMEPWEPNNPPAAALGQSHRSLSPRR